MKLQRLTEHKGETEVFHVYQDCKHIKTFDNMADANELIEDLAIQAGQKGIRTEVCYK